MINGHPQNVNEMFEHHGYWPVRCPEHENHAVLPDETTGDMYCTSGHLVLPVDLGGERLHNAVSLAEEGRRLASEREDLIAQGVDPAELEIPLYPGGEQS